MILAKANKLEDNMKEIINVSKINDTTIQNVWVNGWNLLPICDGRCKVFLKDMRDLKDAEKCGMFVELPTDIELPGWYECKVYSYRIIDCNTKLNLFSYSIRFCEDYRIEDFFRRKLDYLEFYQQSLFVNLKNLKVGK